MHIPNTNHDFVVEVSASACTTIGDDFMFALADEGRVLGMAIPADHHNRDGDGESAKGFGHW